MYLSENIEIKNKIINNKDWRLLLIHFNATLYTHNILIQVQTQLNAKVRKVIYKKKKKNSKNILITRKKYTKSNQYIGKVFTK